ncbi:MAG: succinylglutamate desuccinylase/aspartoacylase family protein [Cyanobacteria bacterium P01_A01_bin.114]
MIAPQIQTIPLLQLASGDELSLQIYQFRGSTPGKKVYLQANLHGAEIAGNAVIHQLIQWLMRLDDGDLAGEIWLVPMCNPLSVNVRSHHFSSGRYSPYDGRDWNRIFWDYEKTNADILSFAKAYFDHPIEVIQQAYRQAIQDQFQIEQNKQTAAQGLPGDQLYRNQLQTLAIDADYLIDLHTSSNRGLTYLYYFQDRGDSAQLFNLDFGILLDEYDGDAFDEAFIKPWLALERIFAELGRPLRFEVEAYTFELGTGMKIDPAAVERGLMGIQNYLSAKGILQTGHPEKTTLPLYPKTQVVKYYATAGGLIQNRLNPGEQITAGERLFELLSFNKTGGLPQVIEIMSEHTGFIYDVSTNETASQGEYVLAVISTE